MKSLRLRWLSLLILVLFALNTSASAKPSVSMRIKSQSDDANQSPIVARIYFSSQEELSLLAGRLDVWDVNHTAGYILAMLRPQDFQLLLQRGFRIEIDEQKTAGLNQRNELLPGQVSGIPGYPCYRTVEETYASLQQLAADYPNLASAIDIGDSWEKVTPGGLSGYDIFSMIITNQSIPGPKPKFFLMAAIHAREYATAELATRFAEHLLANYSIDPDITWMMDYFEIHIVPQTNPDGRKIAEGGELWRKNTDNDDGCGQIQVWGVDLNRNSSFKWGYDNFGSSPNACAETYRGPSAASEPETQAIQTYVASIFPDQRGTADSDPAPEDAMGTFITLHSSGEWVLFPWGWDENPSPNDSSLETLGRKFGFFNQYLVCQSGEPGCIYPTNGSTDDWAYGDLGVAAYTFEIGTEFFQSCSYFENTLVQENFPALMFAFKSARLPYQNPGGPETLNLALDADSVPSGSLVKLTATANDTRFDSNGWGDEPTQPISAARYSVDAPSWKAGSTFPLQAVDGNFDTPIESIHAFIKTTCLSTGRHVIFVESQDASGNWGVPSSMFLNIEEAPFSTCLQPFESEQEGIPGEILTYTFTLSNLGTAVDTFDIQLSGHAWESTLSDTQIGPLGAGESQDFTVSVTIPTGATAGSSDQAIISATSQGDNSKTATATVTTTVKPDYAFEIDPLLSEDSSKAGDSVTHSLTITNTGSLEDSYTSSIGEHNWETSITLPDSPIQPGGSATVTVSVAIPADSQVGAMDQVDITFKSQGDPDQSALVTLVTRVPIPLYLPIIQR